MEINNTGSTYGAAFRQKPIFFMSGKETVTATLAKWGINAIYNENKISGRSEERRVGKECRSRWSPYH